MYTAIAIAVLIISRTVVEMIREERYADAAREHRTPMWIMPVTTRITTAKIGLGVLIGALAAAIHYGLL